MGWKVKPLQGSVAVRLLPQVVTRGNVEIALVNDQIGVPGFGVVEAVGDGCGELEPGMVVFFSAELGRSVQFMGQEVVMVSLLDCLGRLESVPAWVEERLRAA